MVNFLSTSPHLFHHTSQRKREPQMNHLHHGTITAPRKSLLPSHTRENIELLLGTHKAYWPMIFPNKKRNATYFRNFAAMPTLCAFKKHTPLWIRQQHGLHQNTLHHFGHTATPIKRGLPYSYGTNSYKTLFQYRNRPSHRSWKAWLSNFPCNTRPPVTSALSTVTTIPAPTKNITVKNSPTQ